MVRLTKFEQSDINGVTYTTFEVDGQLIRFNLYSKDGKPAMYIGGVGWNTKEMTVKIGTNEENAQSETIVSIKPLYE